MHCPICGSAALTYDLTLAYWREHPLRYEACAQCGAHFANPMPSIQTLTRGNQGLIRHYASGPEAAFKDARKAYALGRALASRLTRWRKHGRLLDIGAFQGFQDYAVQRHSSWEAHAVEIAPDLCRFMRERLGLTVYEGVLESAQLPDSHYDFALCHDLIEHITDPLPFLRIVHRVLKPGGQIEITTPNARQDLVFARKVSAAGTPLTQLLNHIFFFEPRTLRLALERTGFRVRELYCYDIRHSLKDFTKPAEPIPAGPSLEEALKLPVPDALSGWTDARLEELRTHPKTSARYTWWTQTLPRALRVRVPAWIGVGHEIYCLAERV